MLPFFVRCDHRPAALSRLQLTTVVTVTCYGDTLIVAAPALIIVIFSLASFPTKCIVVIGLCAGNRWEEIRYAVVEAASIGKGFIMVRYLDTWIGYSDPAVIGWFDSGCHSRSSGVSRLLIVVGG